MIYDEFLKVYKEHPDGMAFVLCVVGGGGKSSYIRNMAKHITEAGKKVCIMTTTHIARPQYESSEIYEYEGNRILCSYSESAVYVGLLCEKEHRLEYPGDKAFAAIREHFDVVLIEADGSRHLPLKVPDVSREPVIPDKTDAIAVVFGTHAIGKKLCEVCHRYGLQDKYSPETVVTEEIFRAVIDEFYLSYLKNKYRDMQVYLHINDIRPGFIIMASGYGRRFGDNKLIADYQGTPLYKHILFELIKTKMLLRERLNYNSEIILVTRYDEIFEDAEIGGLTEKGILKLCYNKDYEEGIAGSVRNGAKKAHELGCTHYVYCAADMPLIEAEDMYKYMEGYLFSGMHFAVMDDGERISNPGSISSAYYSDVMQIKGDRGGMQVIRKHTEDIYHHKIEKEKLKDIDTRADMI